MSYLSSSVATNQLHTPAANHPTCIVRLLLKCFYKEQLQGLQRADSLYWLLPLFRAWTLDTTELRWLACPLYQVLGDRGPVVEPGRTHPVSVTTTRDEWRSGERVETQGYDAGYNGSNVGIAKTTPGQ
jgi:hypothetical protein